MAADRGSSGRFPCFDGLRALAASSVFFYHFLVIRSPGWLVGEPRTWAHGLGSHGVAIFFVISGFLLYRPFVAAAFSDGHGPRIGSFWLRRFVRIFPAYWIALTAFLFLFTLRPVGSFADGVTYYGLLQNYRGGYFLAGLGIAWTLVVEVGFYLLLPAINHVARITAGAHPRPERVLRVQIGVVAAVAATGLLVRAMGIWVLPAARHGEWFPTNVSASSTLAYLDWFAVGMAFAVASAWSPDGRALPKAAALLARHAGACWLIALALFELQTHLPHLMHAPAHVVLFVQLSVLPITAGFVVFPAVFGPQDETRVRQFLRARPMVYLGGISYGIYLWHYIFVSLAIRWVAHGQLADVLLLRFVVIVSLTISVASVSFYLVEKPLIALAHRATAARPNKRPATASHISD